VVELATGGHEDLVSVAALAHVEDVIADQLVAYADAAGAHDAALGVVHDGRTEALRLGLVHGLRALALHLRIVARPVVLQLALTGLIADRAVDRMVQQQPLLHVGLRRLHHLAGGGDHEILTRRELTRGHQLGLGVGHVGLLARVVAQDGHVHLPAALDVHEAHATVGRYREARMPAVVGDLDPGAPRGTKDRVTGLVGDLLAV